MPEDGGEDNDPESRTQQDSSHNAFRSSPAVCRYRLNPDDRGIRLLPEIGTDNDRWPSTHVKYTMSTRPIRLYIFGYIFFVTFRA